MTIVGDNSRKWFWDMLDDLAKQSKKCYEPCIYRQQKLAAISAPKISLKKTPPVANTGMYISAADISKHISAAVRYSNSNYVNAIDRRRTDELAWRVDRVLRKLRPRYSATGYGELAAGVAAMDEQELRGWLRKLETRFHLRG